MRRYRETLRYKRVPDKKAYVVNNIVYEYVNLIDCGRTSRIPALIWDRVRHQKQPGSPFMGYPANVRILA